MKIIQDNAHKTILEGAKTLYDAVASTLGPKGRNVLIKTAGGLTVTHDGVTVANAVNPEKNSYGVDLIKQSSNRMNDETGDGTTTVTVLTYELIKGLAERIDNGESPMMLKRELEGITPSLLAEIDSRTIDVDKNKLRQVASISAANDEIGELVSNIVWEVGADGTVLTELSKSSKTESEITTGMKINSGYTSPYFVSNDKTGEARLDDTHVLVYDGKIASFQDIVPLMEKLANAGHNKLAIFCESASHEALANLVLNYQKGIFSSLVVEVPSHATVSLSDVAARTGATVISTSAGKKLTQAEVTDLGLASKVSATQLATTIAGGDGDVTEYIDSLDKTDPKTKVRIAAIEGRVAVIRVGGVNETEIEERKYRIDDAILASQAALRSGIVAGGGSTLYTIGASHDNKVITSALQAPYHKLLDNAGITKQDIQNGQCVDVFTERVVDAVDAGIIDPAEVTKNALETALSVAAISITTGTILDTEASDENPAN